MISDKLKQIRKAKKLSQEKAAKILGTTASYLSEIESGKKKNIGANLLTSLLRNMNVNLNWFLSDKGDMFIRNEQEEIEHCLKLLGAKYIVETEQLRQIIESSKSEKTREAMLLLIKVKHGDKEALMRLRQIVDGIELMLE